MQTRKGSAVLYDVGGFGWRTWTWVGVDDDSSGVTCMHGLGSAEKAERSANEHGYEVRRCEPMPTS